MYTAALTTTVIQAIIVFKLLLLEKKKKIKKILKKKNQDVFHFLQAERDGSRCHLPPSPKVQSTLHGEDGEMQAPLSSLLQTGTRPQTPATSPDGRGC